MTPLEKALIDRIRANGPLTVAEYMFECLLHPEHGYYTTKDPLGMTGDFTTSPEISQMFGELIGLAIAQAWIDRGSPSSINLAELGPGRGTLMADILFATKQVPEFHQSLTLHLVELSPVLRRRQCETIELPINHHRSVSDIPDDAPLFLVANEFFDALPVRQFRRDGKGWREQLIGFHGDQLAFGLSDPTNPASLDHRLSNTRDEDIVEFSPQLEAFAGEIADRISALGGVALIVDYGSWRSLGDTFQAVRAHETVSPLTEPGTADLTAHVDFEALSRAVSTQVSCTEMTPQGVFLECLGITLRAKQLAKKLTGSALEQHIAAHRRLTHPDEMGTLFKVMALYQKNTPLPPGFAS